ncbi:MAG: sugar-binding transcriptional regulator [Anaerolineales bacterium]|nr:sugar-binding transcriptional regulator [Anaerolineales bacterium]
MVNFSDRDELLAFVAEKYYREIHNQIAIAKMIGYSRSAVSRMLTEAREKGLVEVIIHHPFQYDHELEEKLKLAFNLKHASVVVFHNQPDYDEVRKQLGKAASRLLASLIKPGHKIGIAWGTSIQATIEAYEANPVRNTQVIQLVGVLGSSRHSYSAQTLVDQMAQNIDGEGIYLYAPFIVENEQTAASLLEDPSVEQAIEKGKGCDIALMGIGTTKSNYCSLYKGNHISLQDLESFQAAGAVGDVCGLYFNIEGHLSQVDFHQRRIGVSWPDLQEIPIRLAVAGMTDKTEAILGAVRGRFANSLVTDNLTAIQVLELAQKLENKTQP